MWVCGGYNVYMCVWLRESIVPCSSVWICGCGFVGGFLFTTVLSYPSQKTKKTTTITKKGELVSARHAVRPPRRGRASGHWDRLPVQLFPQLGHARMCDHLFLVLPRHDGGRLAALDVPLEWQTGVLRQHRRDAWLVRFRSRVCVRVCVCSCGMIASACHWLPLQSHPHMHPQPHTFTLFPCLTPFDVVLSSPWC